MYYVHIGSVAGGQPKSVSEKKARFTIICCSSSGRPKHLFTKRLVAILYLHQDFTVKLHSRRPPPLPPRSPHWTRWTLCLQEAPLPPLRPQSLFFSSYTRYLHLLWDKGSCSCPFSLSLCLSHPKPKSPSLSLSLSVCARIS